MIPLESLLSSLQMGTVVTWLGFGHVRLQLQLHYPLSTNALLAMANSRLKRGIHVRFKKEKIHATMREFVEVLKPWEN